MRMCVCILLNAFWVGQEQAKKKKKKLSIEVSYLALAC